MPIPPLPSHRSPRDEDPLSGRQGLIGGSRGWIAPSVSGSTSIESDTSVVADPALSIRPPGEGRSYAATLNEVRDRAAELADDLDVLGAAGDGLARVRELVGQLRDVAVVALDPTLQPAQRAGLQKQVDLMLGEIDAVASDTQVDEALVRGGPMASAGAPRQSARQLTPYRAIGASMLGLSELGVRSADQALAATGVLDLASSRLERSGKLLNSTTSRLQARLNGLTSPSTTAAGEPALDGETVALSTVMLLRGRLLASSEQSVQAQADLDVPRARWLLG